MTLTATYPMTPPEGIELDWGQMDRTWSWIRDLRGCPQDPIHHAEGDVWTHVRMVCEELLALPVWATLPGSVRDILFAAALLHDVAKPVCTTLEPEGRVSSRGHSRRGALMARRLLWELGVPFEVREAICWLVRTHQVPFWLLEREDSRRTVLEMSQSGRCDWLAILAEADMRGRCCPDQELQIEKVHLFAEYCREEGCFDRPWPFPSATARFEYVRKPDRDPSYAPWTDHGSTVVVMSGLPGSGKDHWIRHNRPDWPVVSLDDIRTEMGHAPTGKQAAVVHRAREMAREHLRAKRNFVWNATNIQRSMRDQVIGLMADYNAYIQLVYIEVPHETLWAQNRNREAAVPDAAMHRMIDRWEPPSVTEAHDVWFVTEP
ncbi:MAG: AAA family ATPase [Myxococcota bacterium]